jgi:hypothetical protein
MSNVQGDTEVFPGCVSDSEDDLTKPQLMPIQTTGLTSDGPDEALAFDGTVVLHSTLFNAKLMLYSASRTILRTSVSRFERAWQSFSSALSFKRSRSVINARAAFRISNQGYSNATCRLHSIRIGKRQP